jgi:2-C-methyl-D-erythritol 4-phosphate cytidylyltransferase / 2-C-methyl-D-erythritol 2,4-cyclodiphosphate synthase
MKVAAVIVAGGSGTRAGGEIPKQYQIIGGKPMIWWSLNAFAQHPKIHVVQPVIAAGQEARFAGCSVGLAIESPVIGGRNRQESCRAGIEAVAKHKPDRVLIHDAARPFVTVDLITDVISGLDRHAGIVPALAVSDTIKHAPSGIIQKTIARNNLWCAQTPQGFGLESILAAHRAAAAIGVTDLTDDSAVAERAGIEVAVIPGRTTNRKLTTATELADADRQLMAQAWAVLPDVRVGQGFDIHSFKQGDAVTLCGVIIPHSRKLKGHSDADVASHALCDAILGAMGEADIGAHFPSSDPRWKNAASVIFLKHAMTEVARRGGALANADVTILAEAPRIAPHVAAMKASLAPILNLATERIAIKATTMEKLGAIGRGEGIAAFATATVRLP